MRWSCDDGTGVGVVARYALPALSGGLLALCFPPLHLVVLPFIALVPYGVWMARLPGDGRGPHTAVRGAGILGAVYFGAIFHWIPVALYAADRGGAAFFRAGAAYLVIVVGLGALVGLSGWLLHRIVHGLGAPTWLALPVVWTSLEWVRAHLPDSLALPWLDLGTSLTAVPEFVGAAEIVGARGITFWIVLVNGLVVTAWLRRSWSSAVAVVVTVATVGGWGFWRASALELRPAARIAVVQPDVARGSKVSADATDGRDVAADLPAVGEGPAGAYQIAPQSMDLVILPELFLRSDPLAEGSAEAVAALESFAGAVGAPVLFGALGAGSHNSAFLLDGDGERAEEAGGGLGDFRYDKHRLVPLVERVPFVGGGGYDAGAGWPVARLAGVGVGVFICYESSYPEVARALRLAGADILVNITNDAWLGGAGPTRPTVALWQHPSHLVMRAIEGRVGIARSAATGISMFVDPLGRIHEATEVGTRSVRVHELHAVVGPTTYHRFGDVVGRACAALSLLVLLRLGFLRHGRGDPGAGARGIASQR